ncbi:MAG: DUF58 domain-containing protein [Mobilitalea sp.]
MLRNHIKYLLILIGLGLLAVLYEDYYLGIIFLTVVALPIVMIGLLSYLYLKISVEFVSVVHIANKGQKIPISVQLNNPTIFPIPNLLIYLTYKNKYTSKVSKIKFAFSIDAKTKTTVVCNLSSEYSGNLEISLQAIRIYDYFKMFSFHKKIEQDIKVAVLPFYYELIGNEILSHSQRLVESDYYSAVNGGDDPSEVFAIREYREGDRPQRIHWKLSSKLNQLMIKEFSDPLNCSIILFVDLSIPEGENTLFFMDALLECALSLSYSYLAEKLMHYFAWYDESLGTCRRLRITQEKDLFEAIDGLFRACPYTKKVDAMSAYQAEYTNDQYSDLIFVTGEISSERMNSLFVLKAVTRQVIYVNDPYEKAEDQLFPEEILLLSREMGIDLLFIDTNNVKRDMEEQRLA